MCASQDARDGTFGERKLDRKAQLNHEEVLMQGTPVTTLSSRLEGLMLFAF